MSNKKLFKFLSEIEKIDTNILNSLFDLNKYQFDILLFLRKHKKCEIKSLVNKINFTDEKKDWIQKLNKEFSRAQKYRLIDDLISKKICKKNKKYLTLNL